MNSILHKAITQSLIVSAALSAVGVIFRLLILITNGVGGLFNYFSFFSDSIMVGGCEPTSGSSDITISGHTVQSTICSDGSISKISILNTVVIFLIIFVIVFAIIYFIQRVIANKSKTKKLI